MNYIKKITLYSIIIILFTACATESKFVGKWKDENTGQIINIANDGDGGYTIEHDNGDIFIGKVDGNKLLLSTIGFDVGEANYIKKEDVVIYYGIKLTRVK